MSARTGIIAALLCTILLFCPGCSSGGPTFVDNDASYTSESAIALLGRGDSGGLAQEGASRSKELRHDALTSLRRRGGTAGEAASIITSTFPGAVRAVPYYVERASLGGTPCWVILEAAGRENGSLEDRRLWVIDMDGAVLLFSAR